MRAGTNTTNTSFTSNLHSICACFNESMPLLDACCDVVGSWTTGNRVRHAVLVVDQRYTTLQNKSPPMIVNVTQNTAGTHKMCWSRFGL